MLTDPEDALEKIMTKPFLPLILLLICFGTASTALCGSTQVEEPAIGLLNAPDVVGNGACCNGRLCRIPVPGTIVSSKEASALESPSEEGPSETVEWRRPPRSCCSSLELWKAMINKLFISNSNEP